MRDYLVLYRNGEGVLLHTIVTARTQDAALRAVYQSSTVSYVRTPVAVSKVGHTTRDSGFNRTGTSSVYAVRVVDQPTFEVSSNPLNEGEWL